MPHRVTQNVSKHQGHEALEYQALTKISHDVSKHRGRGALDNQARGSKSVLRRSRQSVSSKESHQWAHLAAWETSAQEEEGRERKGGPGPTTSSPTRRAKQDNKATEPQDNHPPQSSGTHPPGRRTPQEEPSQASSWGKTPRTKPPSGRRGPSATPDKHPKGSQADS